ncbi:MAG: hypothetical protein JXQ73_07215 [Phycisphaerae bacterium]|nr:hypothetical protein [Phycisphaerae bacterium]
MRIRRTDEAHRGITLSAVETGAIPASIRLTEPWHGESRSPAVKDNGRGRFAATGTPREVKFAITVADER